VRKKKTQQVVLTATEEVDLEAYVLKMQYLGYPQIVGQLCLKVVEMVQTWVTPFLNGIPGMNWLRWFQWQHPILTLRSTQGLEVNRALNLCPEYVSSFYHNLQTMYDMHHYDPAHI
jgi:hypothetical protein